MRPLKSFKWYPRFPFYRRLRLERSGINPADAQEVEPEKKSKKA